MKITCDFPGGNIIVDAIEGDTVKLHQDLRDTEGAWFYWYFRVENAVSGTVRFEFTESVAIGARGPAVSTDGTNWSWLEEGDSTGFSYTFAENSGPVFFSMTVPYTEADWNRFLAGWANHPHVRTGALCRSRGGRVVESITCGHIGEHARHRVLITTRHHCCESLTSFAVEGLIAAILGNQSRGWLRENVEFLIFPFMDKDGVEQGDQGKNRRPRDHNRDYDGESVYAETRALRDLAATWTTGPEIALDLHCPWLKSGLNELIYMVGQRSETYWKEQQRFAEIFEKGATGPLPFRASDNLPFGKEWNVESSYTKGMTFATWAGTLPGVRLVSTFELPYANAGGAVVNAESARSFGADLAKAIEGYLRLS